MRWNRRPVRCSAADPDCSALAVTPVNALATRARFGRRVSGYLSMSRPMRATVIRALPLRTGRAIRDQLLRVEEKPVVVVVAAAGATIVALYLLAASVGWSH